MARRSVLRAAFKQDRAEWKVRLEGEREPLETEWRDWQYPDDPADLLWTILDPHRHADLLLREHALRLCPEKLTISAQKEPIPPTAWWRLRHPTSDCHLLEAGWTVTQLTAVPRPITFDGSIAVVGNDTLHRHLQDALGPKVSLASGNDLPRNSVVVVDGKLSPAACDALRATAEKKSCALMVWLRTRATPSRLIEIVPADDGKVDPSERQWLTRFLSDLRGGIDPEEAFRIASCKTLAPEAWWLRGAAQAWNVEHAGASSMPVPDRWRHRVDRFVQEKMVETMVEALTRHGVSRRVQVIVTPGESKSGLTSFVSRDFDTNECRCVAIDVTWADDPGAEFSRLCECLKVEEDADLANRLAAKARSLGSNGRPSVFVVRHPPVTVGGERDASCRQIELESLRKYMSDLRALAAHLRMTDARVIVHVPVVTESWNVMFEEVLGELTSDLFRFDVLPALVSRVPANEVSFWLRNQGLKLTAGDHDKLASIDSYDDLIRWLAERFPTELGAT